jgi:hypothetical protein
MTTLLTRTELLGYYDAVGDFRGGRARARKGSEWFHINEEGMPAYHERYDYVGSFREGTAYVKKGDRWSRISQDGTRVA